MAQYLENPIPSIQSAKHGERDIKLLYSHHAASVRMIERNITRRDVESALNDANIKLLRNNADKSPSCRLQGLDESGSPIQVIVAYKSMIVVTVYHVTDTNFMAEETLNE